MTSKLTPRTLGSHPGEVPTFAVIKLRNGGSIGRSCTKAERRMLAVVSARPTHFLTLDSNLTERAEFTRAWACLRKRIERRRRKPLIYVATVARSSTERGGYHLHALLWEYIHVPWLIGQAGQVGLGKPHVKKLPEFEDSFRVATYALSQHEPIFGSRNHHRHVARQRHARTMIKPLRSTLATHAPQLLSALDDAKSPTVSDQKLARALPLFSWDRSGS